VCENTVLAFAKRLLVAPIRSSIAGSDREPGHAGAGVSVTR
jgi:hypothetical protein